jgi:nucleotide-binding universal stress UspA family protein
LRAWDRRIRLSARLREAGAASLASAAPGQERAEQALRFALEVARLLGPEIRSRAQALLAALPPQEQARRLEAAPEPPEALDESVGRLIALLAR